MERSGYNSTTGLRFSFPVHGMMMQSHSGIAADSGAQPPFERGSADDLMELNACRLLVDSLQQRINVLERINVDLENRLEKQAFVSIDIERQILEAMKKLRLQEERAEGEREEWTAKFLHQEQKSERLREHLSRTERELYGILQKKYELIRGPGNGAPQAKTKSWENLRKEELGSLNSLRSDDFLTTLQARAPPEIRQKRVLGSLYDFFDL